jgi:putative aldouronate transport system permease protein
MLFVFHYLPMYGVLVAFQDFNMFKGFFESTWVGFKNFAFLFNSSDFYMILKNSLVFSFMRLAWGFPAPILIALMLNELGKQRYKKIIQTTIYLPHFISWVVIAGIVMNTLSPDSGIVNYIIKEMGGKPVLFLQDQNLFRWIIIVTEIWKEAGWGTIIYLAAIAGIDAEMYEAAYIDGASRLQRIIHITLPSISSTIIVLLILRMGHVLRNGFEQIFLLYSPMVYQVADVFETYTYRIGISEGRVSFATAVGVFQSLVGLVLILLTNKLAKKYGEGGLW